MPLFEEEDASSTDCWRSIVLFGRNVACYKFALAQSLLELAEKERTFVRLDELAEPFSRHIVDHLRTADKQATSRSSRFLDACKDYLNGSVSQDDLRATTVRLGFNNVIDAFHIVNRAETPVRFFSDERSGSTPGISLTDDLLNLAETIQALDLPHEVEARWRLVETAWSLNISRNLITVQYDVDTESLFTMDRSPHRVSITSCRKVLNGYQRGKCFYCFADISIAEKVEIWRTWTISSPIS